VLTGGTDCPYVDITATDEPRTVLLSQFDAEEISGVPRVIVKIANFRVSSMKGGFSSLGASVSWRAGSLTSESKKEKRGWRSSGVALRSELTRIWRSCVSVNTMQASQFNAVAYV
jgi:hypothetical protein